MDLGSHPINLYIYIYMMKNTRCPICQTDAMVRPVQLGCNHCMCRRCAVQFTVERGGTECPLCRRDIRGCFVIQTLQDRPFTRGRDTRTRTDYLQWRGRSIVKSMLRPQSFRTLANLVDQLNEIADEDEIASKAIVSEFEKLHFNPVAFHPLTELRASLFAALYASPN